MKQAKTIWRRRGASVISYALLLGLIGGISLTTLPEVGEGVAATSCNSYRNPPTGYQAATSNGVYCVNPTLALATMPLAT